MKSNFDLLDDLEEYPERVRIREKMPVVKPIEPAELRAQHKRKIRHLLTNWPTEWKPYGDNLKAGDDMISSIPPSLVGLLQPYEQIGFSGPNDGIDPFGRTAMHYFCDPKIWAKLNEFELDRLHSLDVLGDLVHAGCSMHTPDKLGETPWQVAPPWIKAVVSVEMKRLQRLRDGLNANNIEDQTHEE